jgi:hypothetical protein
MKLSNTDRLRPEIWEVCNPAPVARRRDGRLPAVDEEHGVRPITLRAGELRQGGPAGDGRAWMKWLIRERVVPTISASVSWLILEDRKSSRFPVWSMTPRVGHRCAITRRRNDERRDPPAPV